MGLPLGKKGWTDREITRTPGPSLVDFWPSEARVGQFTQFTLPTIVKQALVRPHGDAVHSQLVHNVSFNPATGANYPFTDISHRPFPEWGIVAMEVLEGRSNLP